jgi:hypothetical protein
MMTITRMAMRGAHGWIVHRPWEWEPHVLLSGTGQDGAQDSDAGEDLSRGMGRRWLRRAA